MRAGEVKGTHFGFSSVFCTNWSKADRDVGMRARRGGTSWSQRLGGAVGVGFFFPPLQSAPFRNGFWPAGGPPQPPSFPPPDFSGDPFQVFMMGAGAS